MNERSPKLIAWLTHRSRLLSLSWPHGVADLSGIPVTVLNLINQTQSMRGINRSARGYLARTLKVSLRELEEIAAGEIDWIADDRKVDLESLTPIFAGRRNRDIERPAPVASTLRGGVPILGRILANELVEISEGWTQEDVPRTPIRFPTAPDAFALRIECDLPGYASCDCLIFQTVAPGDLTEGELAIITTDETELRQVFSEDPARVLLLPNSSAGRSSRVVAMGDILRAARVIGHCSRRLAVESVESLVHRPRRRG